MNLKSLYSMSLIAASLIGCGSPVSSKLSSSPKTSVKMCATKESTLSSLTGVKNRYWPNGSVLRVRFLNGDRGLQDRIFQAAQKWSSVANVKFKRVQSGESDIRIRIHDATDNDEGSWSYIGTYAKDIPQNEVTMNFGWLLPETEDLEVNRVVLHEFGHALGFAHEHQNPLANISWNKEATYDYYAWMGWSRADVDRNIFSKLTATDPSEYDVASIMHYPIDASLTLDGFSVPWNTSISAIDAKHAAKLYPPFQPGAVREFEFFDSDRDGQLDLREIYSKLVALGSELDESQVEEILMNQDGDGNGLLSPLEYDIGFKAKAFPWQES